VKITLVGPPHVNNSLIGPYYLHILPPPLIARVVSCVQGQPPPTSLLFIFFFERVPKLYYSIKIKLFTTLPIRSINHTCLPLSKKVVAFARRCACPFASHRSWINETSGNRLLLMRISLITMQCGPPIASLCSSFTTVRQSEDICCTRTCCLEIHSEAQCLRTC
jgi:hypothetical protein